MFLVRRLSQRDGQDAYRRAKTLVAAAGGFEANIEWLKEYWGDAADNFLIRGTPYNRGTVSEDAARQGRAGDRRSHAMPRGRDRRARAEIRRRHHHATRLRRVRHRRQQATPSASTTRAKTSGRSATRSGAGWSPHSPTRSPTSSSMRPRSTCSCRRCFPPISARLDRANSPASSTSIRPCWKRPWPISMPRCGPARSITPILDDCRTEGLTPPKTHWARKIETAPFYAYPVRPGITFTYLGIRVNKRVRAC